MAAENPNEFINQQLADRFLIIEPDSFDRVERQILLLNLPNYSTIDNPKIIIANPSSVKIETMFTVRTRPPEAGGSFTEKPAAPDDIALIIAVAKLRNDLDPQYLQILRNVANMRLLEIEEEIQRIRQQI